MGANKLAQDCQAAAGTTSRVTDETFAKAMSALFDKGVTAADPASFQPHLGQLDAVIRSLKLKQQLRRFPMDECLLYSEPELYDLLFPSARASATVQDAERRKRIVASESFYLEEAGKGGRVLELACGTGRLTVPIAQRGVEIVAIDSSPTMLDTARAKAAASGAPVTFVQGDMRAYELGQRFGLVFIAGNSLQHMLSAGDLGHCFACARRHLAAGGRLVFDVSNPDRAHLARDPNPRYPVLQVDHPQRGLVSLEETARYEPLPASAIWSGVFPRPARLTSA